MYTLNMLKRIIAVATIIWFALGAVSTAGAQTTSSPEAPASPAVTSPQRGASVCMKAATEKKRVAFKAAKEKYHAAMKLARKNKDRQAKKTAGEAYRKEHREASAAFAADRKDCVARLRAATAAKKAEGTKDGKKAGPTATIEILPQNSSGISGKAGLTALDGKVVARVNLSGVAVSSSHPAHLHSGTCAALGAIRFALNPIVDGKSQTPLDVPYETLKGAAPLALNVHKSEAELGVYVACGDVKF